MFAANSGLYVCSRAAAAFDCNAHKFADTVDIDTDERILLQQSAGKIVAQERSRIVAGDIASFASDRWFKAEELSGQR